MLFLKFQMGAEGYLLDVEQIAEVLPLVNLKRIPQAPAGIAGLLNYRGKPIPAIDLSELATGQPAARLLSTRLVLVHHTDSTGQRRLLGLIMEKATETVQRNLSDFTEPAVVGEGTPYLGSIVHDGTRLLQRVDLRKLLPESVSSALYRQAEEESWSSHASKLS